MNHTDDEFDEFFRADSKEATRILSLDDLKALDENQAKLEQENDDLRQQVERLNQTVISQERKIEKMSHKIESLQVEVEDLTLTNLNLSESLTNLSSHLAESKTPQTSRPSAELQAKSVMQPAPSQRGRNHYNHL